MKVGEMLAAVPTWSTQPSRQSRGVMHSLPQNVCAHRAPFPAGTLPPGAQGLQGWLVPSFRLSSGLSDEGEK